MREEFRAAGGLWPGKQMGSLYRRPWFRRKRELSFIENMPYPERRRKNLVHVISFNYPNSLVVCFFKNSLSTVLGQNVCEVSIEHLHGDVECMALHRDQVLS